MFDGRRLEVCTLVIFQIKELQVRRCEKRRPNTVPVSKSARKIGDNLQSTVSGKYVRMYETEKNGIREWDCVKANPFLEYESNERLPHGGVVEKVVMERRITRQTKNAAIENREIDFGVWEGTCFNPAGLWHYLDLWLRGGVSLWKSRSKYEIGQPPGKIWNEWVNRRKGPQYWQVLQIMWLVLLSLGNTTLVALLGMPSSI